MILNNIQKLPKLFASLLLIAFIAVAAQAQNLTGEWRVIEMKSDGEKFQLTGENTPTLIFGEENRATGNAGCNRYGSSYEAEGKTIDFKQIISTKMACVDEQRNQQESKYFAVLDKVERYKMTKKYLTLYDKNNGNTLKLVRIAQSNDKTKTTK